MMSDMRVIEQQTPSSGSGSGRSGTSGSNSSSARSQFESDSFFDDFEVVDETPVTGLEGYVYNFIINIRYVLLNYYYYYFAD